jgi:site-specific recombinase XerD
VASGARGIVKIVDKTLARYDTDRLVTLSADRRSASLRVLDELRAATAGLSLASANAAAVRRVLDESASACYGPRTLRKHRAIMLAFFAWAYEERVIDAETLLAVRSIRPPVSTSAAAAAQPYRPGELRALRRTLDERWPKLAEDEVLKWLRRFRDGRSPYARVRSHAIRCQLDAIVALALHLGLRRREIFALDIVTAHSDNDQVIVWTNSERSVKNCRVVPFKNAARAAMSAWVDCRHAIAPEHKQLWLNLHAEPTSRLPITAETFNRVLATNVGRGWTLKRFRDTCAAAWVRAGLPPEKLRELLGLARIEDVLPYLRLVKGSLEGRMAELDEHFDELVAAAVIADAAA